MRLLEVFGALVLVASLSIDATAQPAVEHETLPDLDFNYTSVDHQRGKFRALVRAAAAGGYRIGPEQAWLTQGDVDFLMGATSTRTDVFKLRSRLSLIGDLQPGDQTRPAVATIGGRHRLLLRHGFGGFQGGAHDRFKDGALGADLVVEGHGSHGRIGYGSMRYDVGDGRFGTMHGRIGAWLRRGLGSRQALVMPIRVRYGASRIEAVGGDAGWTRKVGVDAGFGIKHYFDFHYHGYVEGAGMAWDRYAPADGASVDRFELRALHLDDVTFRGRGELFPLLRDEHLLFVRSWIGGHWLTAEQGTRSIGIVAFELAAGLRFPFEKAHAELVVGGGREGAPSAYSGQFVDRYRVESRASLNIREYGFGSDTRVVSAWQSNLETGSEYSQQLAVSSSIWLELCECLALGVYQRAQQGLPVGADAFLADATWRHDVGLFVRLRGGERGGERLPAGQAGFSAF